MRQALSRCLILSVFALCCLAANARTAFAQAGTILSWQKHNSATLLSSVGLTLHDSDEFGDALAWLGDLDGAGPSVAAMAVGAIGDDDGGSHKGAVYILFFNSAGTVTSFQKISAIAGGFTGTLDSDDEFGSSVANLGDIDGAGGAAGAIAVGCIGDDDGGTDHGAVYVLRLNANGTVFSTTKVTSVQAGVPADITGDGEEFGGATCGLGDLDGAGPAASAMAVGCIGDNDGGVNRGCVFIVFLSNTGAYLSSQKISDTAGGFTAVMEDNDNFGEDIANIGDRDGAGGGVLTICATAVDDNDGGTDSGAVYLIHLNPNGTVNGYSKISRLSGGWAGCPVTNYDNFGTAAVGLGDLDGAGPAAYTLAVTAGSDDGAGLNRGATYLLYLNAAGSVLSYQEISSVSGGTISAAIKDDDEFGSALTALGDIDGAGPAAQTLISGVGYDDDGGLQRGAFYRLSLQGGSVPAGNPPVVTAPATASGNENTLITVNVTAADADGPAISSLVASGLPTGATFTPNGSNTAGTLSWTPTYAQSGSYTITFTASNTLSGSASTTITVNNVDRAPTVTAPPTASGNENSLITVNVTASDPDGTAITSLTATNLPAGATFTPNGSKTAGTLSWTPSYTQSGVYTVTFTATNALSGSANTQITVNNVDQAPVVTAPATASANENALLTVNVTAADPDGSAITTLTATNLPSGATFTPNGSKTAGTLSWTPTYSQSGVYTVTFTATNALSGSSNTQVTINNVDRAPAVTAPPTASGPENTLLTVNVTAADPDGQSITSLTATNLPSGATFTPNGSNTSGTLSWTPTFSQSGVYTVTFTATNALSGSANTQITVSNADRAPAVVAPPFVFGDESTPLTVNVTASDPDGQAITSLTVSSLPSGATFTPSADKTSGQLSWTPGYNQAGDYTFTFTASNALSGTGTTFLTIGDHDRAPVVTAPASAYGREDSLMTINVSCSDPDGDAIASLEATDLPTGAVFTPSGDKKAGTLTWTPTVTQGGNYTVTFTATNIQSGSASTAITIGEHDRAPEITAPTSCAMVEGQPHTIDITVSDPDGQPITTLEATDLPTGATFTPGPDNTTGKLQWTPDPGQNGHYNILITATNALVSSHGLSIDVTIPSTGVIGAADMALLRPMLAPSPLRTRSVLSFRTVEAGPIEVDLLDLSGRRVRLLMSTNDAAAGVYQVSIDGRDEAGEQLRSGLYFYRIHSARRAWTGRLVVTR